MSYTHVNTWINMDKHIIRKIKLIFFKWNTNNLQ